MKPPKRCPFLSFFPWESQGADTDETDDETEDLNLL